QQGRRRAHLRDRRLRRRGRRVHRRAAAHRGARGREALMADEAERPAVRRGLPRPGQAPDAPAPAEETPAAAPAPGARRGLPRAAGATPTPVEAAAATPPAASEPSAAAATTASEPRRLGRFTARQWTVVAVVGLLALTAVAAALVLGVRALLQTEGMQEFLARYPGEYGLPEGAP